MDELSAFIKRLLLIYNKKRCIFEPGDSELSIGQAREVLREINDFLFTTYTGIGIVRTDFYDSFPYFSEFHRYWYRQHKQILDFRIVDNRCKEIAASLHEVWKRTEGKVFKGVFSTYGLTAKEICNIRMFTANQDFRGLPDFGVLSTVYKKDPDRFQADWIVKHPEDFVRQIKVLDLGQSEKRVTYAKRIAEFVILHGSEPLDLAQRFDNDAAVLRDELMKSNAGYGKKKSDMFIRDMVVLNVWNGLANFDKIDVASDINTIKVALRTGILTSSIPSLTSFLDIFSYQYSLIDDMNTKAWRRVWEIWKESFPTECISSPCLADYFVFDIIGRQFCKEILYKYSCDSSAHEIISLPSSRNKICPVCKEKRIRGKLVKVGAVLPCTDVNGSIAIKATQAYSDCKEIGEECPFKSICTSNGTYNLRPPKSISILGQTGWASGYSKRGEGGGGIMS